MPFKKKEIKKVLSQEEYERRIKELQDELEELKKIKIEDNKPKKGEIWKPDFEKVYYYLDFTNEVCPTVNNETAIDANIFECGNFYKTKEEAEYQANVQKYTALFRKYVEEHSEPLSWNNVNARKYFLKWSFYDETFIFDYYCGAKAQGTIFASSTEILEDAIEFVGKENVIKYVLGVDESRLKRFWAQYWGGLYG